MLHGSHLRLVAILVSGCSSNGGNVETTANMQDASSANIEEAGAGVEDSALHEVPPDARAVAPSLLADGGLHADASAELARCMRIGDENTIGLESLASTTAQHYDAAKTACDAELGAPVCGDFRVTFDSRGCLANVETATQHDGDGVADLEACLVRQMSAHCDLCASNGARRVYHSCTLL